MLKNSVLKRLFPNETIKIGVTGKVVIAQLKEIFNLWFDSNFLHWGLLKCKRLTKETKVEVYELTEDATYKIMFAPFGRKLNKLSMTLGQLADFCHNNQQYLHPKLATFILLKKKICFFWRVYFVADVYAHSDGLDVSVHRFEYGFVWGASGRPWVVVLATD